MVLSSLVRNFWSLDKDAVLRSTEGDAKATDSQPGETLKISNHPKRNMQFWIHQTLKGG